MQTTLIKVGEGYELRTTNRNIGDELAQLAKATPFFIAGATYKRQRLSTGRTRQGYSGFFAFEPHEFVQGAADTVVCLDGLLKCSAPRATPTGGSLSKAFTEHASAIGEILRGVESPTLYLQQVGRVQRQTFSAENPQHQQIPKPAQWDGEGLPPVGVDCEVLWDSNPVKYVTCKIVGHDYRDHAVYRYTSGEANGSYRSGVQDLSGHARLPWFRPIKTAEQLAAEQREAEAQRVCDRFALFGDEIAVDWKALFGQMYDSGMRFPEEK